jgi:hypothetical protein
MMKYGVGRPPCACPAEQLRLEAAEANTEGGSLVRISAAVGSPAALQPGVRLLALALKGSLVPAGEEGGGAAGPGPLAAVNIDGSPALVTPLLQAMLVPRIALQTAELRQARFHSTHSRTLSLCCLRLTSACGPA